MATSWQQLLRDPKLTPGALRDAFRLALLATGEVGAVSDHPGDPSRCEIRTRSGKTFSVHLSGLYEEARSEPGPRREVLLLARVGSALDTAHDLDGTAPAPSARDVVPTLKSSIWVADALGMAPDLASEPLAADLVVVYAFDRPTSMAYATRAQLDAVELSGERLRSTALANLRARLPAQLETRGDDKSFTFIAGGNFEASLILLDEVWDQLRSSLPGDPVVCAVARDVCLVTSTGLPGGVQGLVATRDRFCAGGAPPHFISKTLLRRVAGRWVPFVGAL